jgi:hypothetical protein
MKTKDHKHKFQLSVILVCKIKQTILKLDVYNINNKNIQCMNVTKLVFAPSLFIKSCWRVVVNVLMLIKNLFLRPYYLILMLIIDKSQHIVKIVNLPILRTIHYHFHFLLSLYNEDYWNAQNSSVLCSDWVINYSFLVTDNHMSWAINFTAIE